MRISKKTKFNVGDNVVVILPNANNVYELLGRGEIKAVYCNSYNVGYRMESDVSYLIFYHNIDFGFQNKIFYERTGNGSDLLRFDETEVFATTKEALKHLGKKSNKFIKRENERKPQYKGVETQK